MPRKYEESLFPQCYFLNLAPKQQALQFLYNFLIKTAEKILPVSGIFSDKMKLFIEGRKNLFHELQQKIAPSDRTIWFHAASLGEYEQAVPVIEEVKNLFPELKVVVTFYSPSGYEIKKHSKMADVIAYMPLDTPKNVRRFLDLVHPEMALFIKYEFWPNFLKELQVRAIPTFLVSGVFRKDQMFFKNYGKWMRPYLRTFDHFFVQNDSSKKLLSSIGFKNVTLSGDTRFDRVTRQLSQDNHLDFIETFKNGKFCVVAGSTWPEDEALMTKFINEAPQEIKFIIAPHTIKPERIKKLKQALTVRTVLFSDKENKDLSQFQVFIIDTIGLLGRIYSYADVAYVGGAAGETGLHNILEPATFGVPVIIGKNFEKFPEAFELQDKGGLFPVPDKEKFSEVLSHLINDEDFRIKTSRLSANYIKINTGATQSIINYLKPFLNNN